MLVNGKRIRKDKEVEVINPYNDQVVYTLGMSDTNDVEKAITIAERGFRILKEMPAGQRARILENASDIIQQRKREFSHAIALECGKTIHEARAEVDRAVNTMKLSALAALKLTGETVRFDLAGQSRKMGFYIRVPLGIVCAITPFNFPLNLSCHKIGPAIAAGNAIIHKPATKTPVSGVMLAEALIDAGLPIEGITVLVGSGSTIGMSLIKHPLVKKISFTGSLEVGETITANCGMKRVTMELGSNSAVVAFKDAPIDLVAKKVRRGGYTLAGQVCISIQRVYVEEEIADDFLTTLASEVSQIRYGDQLSEETEMGPMIDHDALGKAQRFCEDAVQQGGRIVIGGKREGNIFTPTIISDVSEDSLIVQEEAFAPIVAVNKFRTVDEAIQKVNNTKYGLQAGVFTADITKAIACARAIDAGGVLINEMPTFRVDNMPYGGTKGSGIGREGPDFAIKEMTEEKLIIFDQL
ncbi:aldehyde dehydrogenase [candidate division WOR_3 bacterium SM1_77]|jgi:glyceraldehyde-3-phosphate dehydrogenase (NADP+)|uniref:Aldehyde dehydrogenase n=1 Tax=candidate division WOR_3 bacterium SM1_77 TaxID=1703778 RepID=A0A0S8K0Y8_UNCW3|nr:MAG: aldehyde dehydrogenase [candidate division WOR_3 bacterium SM1_77]